MSAASPAAVGDTPSTSPRELVRRHRIVFFLAVTYAATWGAWIPLGHHVGPGFDLRYLLGLLGPMVGALVTTAVVDGTRGLRELAARMTRARVGLRWWLFALGLPLAVFVVCFAALAAYGAVELPTWNTLGELTGFPLTNAFGLWLALVAINGFGEEVGWRGFLLPQLQRAHSPLVASLIVAALWAAWHIPAFFVVDTYRAMPIAMLPMFVLGLVSGAVILAWLYNRGRGSILLAAVFHGTYNLFSGTVGARGFVAAIESTVVMVVAVVLVILQLRDARRQRARSSGVGEASSSRPG